MGLIVIFICPINSMLHWKTIQNKTKQEKKKQKQKETNKQTNKNQTNNKNSNKKKKKKRKKKTTTTTQQQQEQKLNKTVNLCRTNNNDAITFMKVVTWNNFCVKHRPYLRGYCTSGPYFWRLCAFSQKIKQLRTKYPMDLVRNVPRNSKMTVLLQ